MPTIPVILDNGDTCDVRIVQNGAIRLLLDWDQLTPKEQRKFRCSTDNTVREQQLMGDYVRYMGQVYQVDDTELVDSKSMPYFKGWDGWQMWHASAGVLFRYVGDTDHVQVARYYVVPK